MQKFFPYVSVDKMEMLSYNMDMEMQKEPNREKGFKAAYRRFQERHGTLVQMLKFWLLGGIATVVDLGVFALCNYWLFVGYKSTPVTWWLLDYRVENGGLCALLSFAISYAVSQTVNFFVQRKATFGATNNVALSAVLYLIMILGVYAFTLWLPTLILAPIEAWAGAALGDVLVKLICQFASFLIQFPLNK